MVHDTNRLVINHIVIGFKDIVPDGNFADSHRTLVPFGSRWGRGILIHGDGYLEAITGNFGCTHSVLKMDMCEDEETRGAFYYGYVLSAKTLYLEYATDRTFDFYDNGILDAIMDSLKRGNGPLKDFILGKIG